LFLSPSLNFMAITRIVDSEDDSDEGVRRKDDEFIDDSEAARFTAKEKGKGRVTRQQNKDSNGNTVMLEAQDDDDDEAEEEEESDDEDAGPRKRKGPVAGGGAKPGGGGGSSRVKLAWEEEYSRSWDALTEDVHGSLEGAVAAFLTNSKRRRILRDTAAIQRGIIRHLYLVLDLSESMSDRDMRPSRLELMLKYSAEFVGEFFDQNPISQLAIIGTQNGMANRISPLGGNPVEHLKKLQDLASKKKDAISGEPSLQNALNMARSGLAHLPTHGSREVVVIFGSLTTCDPGNIHDTIDALAKDR
jgi:transcription initiation factor TFIIH subunit 2